MDTNLRVYTSLGETVRAAAANGSRRHSGQSEAKLCVLASYWLVAETSK